MGGEWGSLQRDLPDRFGTWKTVYERFRRWRADGRLNRVVARLQRDLDREGLIDWAAFCVDATSVRASRAAAGARKRGAQPPRPLARASRRIMPLGRSRGGLTTKVHLVADRGGVPLAFVLTAGQRHESTAFEAAMDAVSVARERGRPRQRPRRVLADAAYDADRIRRWCRRRGIGTTIKANGSRKPKRGRPFAFGRARNVVERTIGHLKEHCRVGSRSEKLAVSYRAMVQVAFIERYLRLLESPDTA